MKETLVTNIYLSFTHIAFEDTLTENQKCYFVPDNVWKNEKPFFPHTKTLFTVMVPFPAGFPCFNSSGWVNTELDTI